MSTSSSYASLSSSAVSRSSVRVLGVVVLGLVGGFVAGVGLVLGFFELALVAAGRVVVGASEISACSAGYQRSVRRSLNAICRPNKISSMTNTSIVSAYMRGFCCREREALGDVDGGNGRRTGLARLRLEEPAAARWLTRAGTSGCRLDRDGVAFDDVDRALTARAARRSGRAGTGRRARSTPCSRVRLRSCRPWRRAQPSCRGTPPGCRWSPRRSRRRGVSSKSSSIAISRSQESSRRACRSSSTSSSFTRACSIVSRSRTVTASSSSDSKSTVTHSGVPTSSWRR